MDIDIRALELLPAEAEGLRPCLPTCRPTCIQPSCVRTMISFA